MVGKESLAFKALWVEKVNLISVVKTSKILRFCSQITLFLCKVSWAKRKLMTCTEITTVSSTSTRSKASAVSDPPTCSYRTQASSCSSQNEQNLSSRSSTFPLTCRRMCPETIKTKRRSRLQILIFDTFFRCKQQWLIDKNITLEVIRKHLLPTHLTTKMAAKVWSNFLLLATLSLSPASGLDDSYEVLLTSDGPTVLDAPITFFGE